MFVFTRRRLCTVDDFLFHSTFLVVVVFVFTRRRFYTVEDILVTQHIFGVTETEIEPEPDVVSRFV